MKSKDISSGSRILIIPDTQVKPGVNTDHLEWAGHYAVKMKPDVIVHIGDHWDMPSLSSYDKKGSRQMEGKRYVKDIDAGNEAMDRFMAPIHAEVARLKKGKRKAWNPRLVYTMGNHENRINRAVDADAQLEDLISTDDFNLAEHGFEVVPFLEPIVIDGVVFCHYICSGVMGRSISVARIGLTKRHQSFVQGHVQQRDIAEGVRADGKRIPGSWRASSTRTTRATSHPSTTRGRRGQECGCCTTCRTESSTTCPSASTTSGANMDWRAEQKAGELWTLVDAVWAVEEIEIAKIRDLCDDHGISCEKFIEIWGRLCDEGHIIINQAEERIY